MGDSVQLYVSDLPQLLREWDYEMNKEVDPTTDICRCSCQRLLVSNLRTKNAYGPLKRTLGRKNWYVR